MPVLGVALEMSVIHELELIHHCNPTGLCLVAGLKLLDGDGVCVVVLEVNVMERQGVLKRDLDEDFTRLRWPELRLGRHPNMERF